jgi:hypothetical protein
MKAMSINQIRRALGRVLRRFLADGRGSSDPIHYCLWAIGGTSMICIAIPHFFRGADAFGNGFERNVSYLDDNSNPGGQGGGLSAAGGNPAPNYLSTGNSNYLSGLSAVTAGATALTGAAGRTTNGPSQTTNGPSQTTDGTSQTTDGTSQTTQVAAVTVTGQKTTLTR